MKEQLFAPDVTQTHTHIEESIQNILNILATGTNALEWINKTHSNERQQQTQIRNGSFRKSKQCEFKCPNARQTSFVHINGRMKPNFRFAT